VIPPIGIEKYLMRLSKTFQCSDASFIAALVIVDRLLEYDGGRLPLTMRNVHRIFFASLVVAAKFHEDLVYSNAHYAKAGGVQLKEVNRLERVLLQVLDFDIRVDLEQYQMYEAALLALIDKGPQRDTLSATGGGLSKVPTAQGAVAQAAGAFGNAHNAQKVVLPSEAKQCHGAAEDHPAVQTTGSSLPVQTTGGYTFKCHPQACMGVSGPWVKTAPRPDMCAPWVVPPQHSASNFDLAMMVPTSVSMGQLQGVAT
jgi:hypothetical protein